MKKVLLILAVIIILSAEGNGQWYYKKYGVKDLSQLSQEQLNKRLRLDKMIIGFDFGAMIFGTAIIIRGAHLINEGNAERWKSVPGFYYSLSDKPVGIMLLSSGILIDICGLILLPLDLTEINKIKKVLGNHEIKLGLINYKTANIFNSSNISQAPVISITIHF